MSDRVDEQREQQRIEQARLAAQRSEIKRTGEAGEFKKVVAAMQQFNAQTAKQDTTKQDKNNAATTRLAVRDGSARNTFARKTGLDSDKRLLSNRQRNVAEGAESDSRQSVTRRVKTQEDNAKRENLNPGPRSQSNNKKKSTTDDQKGSRAAGDSRREQLMASHAGIQMVNPLAGLAAKSSSGAAGAQPLTSAQVIDQIVKAVRQGVDAKGMGLIEIDLKDDVMAGAQLRLLSTKQGVSLEIHSQDEQVSRLLSSGATAQELSQTLKLAGIHLQSLEVNRKKVLG